MTNKSNEIDSDLNRLIAIKILLDKSRGFIDSFGQERLLSILALHDALDFTLQYRCVIKKIKIGSTDSLINLAKKLELKGTDQQNLEKLNKYRNNFKHNYILPDREDLNRLYYWCEGLIEESLKSSLNINLDTIDMAQTVFGEQYKLDLQKIKKLFEEKKPVECITKMSKLFSDILDLLYKKFDYQADMKYTQHSTGFLNIDRVSILDFFDNKESGSYDTNHPLWQLPTGENSNFNDNKFTLASTLKGLFTEIFDRIKFQDKILVMKLLNIELSDFDHFARIVPKRVLSDEGDGVKYKLAEEPEELSKNDFNFCYNFLISCVNKLEGTS